MITRTNPKFNVAPFVNAVEKSTLTDLSVNVANGMKAGIAAYLKELIAEREQASLRTTKASDSKAVGAQIASLNVVLAFVANLEIS